MSAGTAGTGGSAAAMCQPSAGPCDEVNSAGCAVDQKCTLGDAMNPTRGACGGAAATGQACAPTFNGDTCASGNICLADSKCYKFCRTDADCPGQGSCLYDLLFSSGLSSGKKACSGPPQACSPTAPGTVGCPAGQGCYMFGGAAGNMCLTAGTRDVGQSCSSTTECDPGNLCVSVNGGGSTCLQVCNLASPTCGGGRTCRMLTGGGNQYGACI
jgi:hypothetical protein